MDIIKIIYMCVGINVDDLNISYDDKIKKYDKYKYFKSIRKYSLEIK